MKSTESQLAEHRRDYRVTKNERDRAMVEGNEYMVRQAELRMSSYEIWLGGKLEGPVSTNPPRHTPYTPI